MEIRINLAVRGTQCTAELEQDMPITTGSRGVFRAVLHADSSWDAMDKTLVFRSGQISRSQHIGIDGTSCLVPPEVLAERAPYLEIGVYGTAGEDVVRTTTWARLHGIVPGAVPTGDAMESPDLYAQLLAQLNATVRTVNGQAPDENGNVTVEVGGGGAGTPGGYYTPTVTQPDGNTMRVSYTPSDSSMPAVESSDVTLPSGAGGKTAYEYAQGGGYTGTEEAFSTRLAQEIPAVDSTLTQSGQAADAAAVGDRLSALSEEIGSLGGDTVSVEPAEDDIPKVFFGGALQQTKDAAVVPFRYISKTQDISGYAEIKAQGNSSMSYPKKNQTVKLFKDADCTEKLKVDFKGWGMQNKHVYKANWIDLSHARNIVSARLWADVVKSRAGYENLPELLRTSPNHGAVDGFPVKVYAAGVYQGRYTLNIPKDKWMVNMDDALDTHCILCGENYVSGCFRAAASINGSDWTDEIHDTVPDAIKTRWNEVISFVMNSTDDEFVAGLGDYFYVDSLIDYHLFGLASCGLDAYGKNQIYMTYDGQKWIASMYDMDSTWGLYWNGGKFVTTDYARTSYEDFVSAQSSGEGNLLYIRLEQCFYTELQARWTELKNGALSIENIINRFERFTDIAKSELVKEDYASTTGGGAFIGIPSQSTNNIQQIRSFALARQTWCDEYIAGLTPAVKIPCTSITLSAETLTFSEAGTQTLTATVEPENTTDSVVWSVDDNSVADVSGGTVTAKANGSCVVTVTCGEKSATCDVFVSGIESGGNEGGFELAPEDTMYSLGNETSFDGSSDYIDTGIYLFDTAKDFTILLHADLAQQTMSNASCVIHCIDEDAALWPGLSIESVSAGYKLGGAVDTSNAWGIYADRLPNTIDKIVIRASNGIVNAVRYANNGEIVDYVFSKEYKYVVATQPLVLGCRLNANGNRDRYWKGVIYGFDVANRALTDDEITSFLTTQVNQFSEPKAN